MKKLILCLMIGFIFANFAEARIGETLPELKKRFGEGQALYKSYVKAPNKAIYDFSKNGIKIRAYFIENKCEMISYSRMSGISEQEAKKLLNANGGLSHWLPDNTPKVYYPNSSLKNALKSWSRDNYKVYATYIKRSFYLMTKNYINKLKQALKKPKQNKSLDGF